MADNSNSWELKTPDDVAGALDWVRRRMKGNGLVLIAVGVNTIAFAKDPKLDSDDAANMLADQAATLRREFERISTDKVTRGFARREQ